MRYCVGLFFLLLILTNSAWPANLRIVGEDITWSPGAASSPISYVLVLREQGDTDRLWAWQLRLEIVPMEDATGLVQFAWADLPRGPEEDYLLAGDSSTLDGPDPPPEPWLVGPMDDFSMFDSAWTGDGAEVPLEGKSLLKISFSASEDAEGVFGIAIASDPAGTDTFWIDSDLQTHNFANVPDSSLPVIIGRLTIGNVVPEPGMLWMLCSGLTILAIGWRGRRGM